MSRPTPSTNTTRRIPRWLIPMGVLVAFGAGVVVLMLWLMGTFKPKVPATANPLADHHTLAGATVVPVEVRTIPREETAIGSIEPVHRVEVASRILARAVEVSATAGQAVAKDQVLVRLEDADLRARVAQADSMAAQARAALDQAISDESRMRIALDKNAVAASEYDRASNTLKATEAALTAAMQSQIEAQTLLSYATIRSPIDGTIVDKRVNAGDMVSPGQVVVTVLDPRRMQLVASVRESLSRTLRTGDTVTVRVDALDDACTGIVSEIVPQASGSSRSFLVKVTGPCPEGVYAGMFGRLSIPLGEESVLLIPARAISTIGQIESVDLVRGDALERRAIRTGRRFDGMVEVLAGLTPVDRVALKRANGERGTP